VEDFVCYIKSIAYFFSKIKKKVSNLRKNLKKVVDNETKVCYYDKKVTESETNY